MEWTSSEFVSTNGDERYRAINSGYCILLSRYLSTVLPSPFIRFLNYMYPLTYITNSTLLISTDNLLRSGLGDFILLISHHLQPRSLKEVFTGMMISNNFANSAWNFAPFTSHGTVVARWSGSENSPCCGWRQLEIRLITPATDIKYTGLRDRIPSQQLCYRRAVEVKIAAFGERLLVAGAVRH